MLHLRIITPSDLTATVNPPLQRLRAAGVPERGGITMTELETVISTAADRAPLAGLTGGRAGH